MSSNAIRRGVKRRYERLKREGLCPRCMGKRINEKYVMCEKCRRRE